MHALMFSNFGTVVKASKGIRESAAAEKMFPALEAPVWLCECLCLGEVMALAGLHCTVCPGTFSKAY